MSKHDPSTPALRRVGILVFDNVEVLDFAGPFEVFAVTAELAGQQHFKTVLVGAQDRVYTAVNGMKVLPNDSFADGHAEVWRWRSPTTVKAGSQPPWLQGIDTAPRDPDLLRVYSGVPPRPR